MQMPAHLCDNEVTERLDSYTGEVTYGTGEKLQEIFHEKIYPTFWGTEVGQQFVDRYIWDEMIENRVAALLKKKYGESGTPKSGVDYPGAILVWRLESVIGDLMLIGDPALTSNVVEEPTAPEPPALKRFREQKVLQQEIEFDLGNGGFGGISTRAIEAKCHSRSDYKKMFEEMRTPEVPEPLSAFSQEVNDFAVNYHAARASDLKQQGGIRRINGITYGNESYERLLAQAIQHGLI
jgi:hypothetical protein